jgi:hypothetical protein
MIIHDPIICQRIQTILALGDRACLFLQPIPLQSIYLSNYWADSKQDLELILK